MSRRRKTHRLSLARQPGGLTRHRRRPSTIVLKREFKRVAMRDCSRRCVYCAASLGLEALTLDHVHPRSRGGSHTAGNLVASCASCNRLKGDMLPNEFFARHPWAGLNFIRYARAAHRALKKGARRAVSLALAAA